MTSLPVLSNANAAQMSTTMVTFVLIIAIFYFLLIRPQRKKDKETKAMINAMKKGDKIVSIGGIHGTIITVKDQTVVVKVDDSARLEFSKSAIASVTPKEAAKANPKKKEEVKEEAKAEVKEAALETKTEGAPAEAEGK